MKKPETSAQETTLNVGIKLNSSDMKWLR